MHLTTITAEVGGKKYGVAVCRLSFGEGEPLPLLALIAGRDRAVLGPKAAASWLRRRGLDDAKGFIADALAALAEIEADGESP